MNTLAENPKTRKTKKNPKKPEVEKPEFYWFGLIYRFKNPTSMIWFDIQKIQTNPVMNTARNVILFFSSIYETIKLY